LERPAAKTGLLFLGSYSSFGFVFWPCGSVQLPVGLKSDFEVRVLGVEGDFFDFGFPYIAGKGILDVPDAIGNIVGRALGEHFNGALRCVADKAGQLIAIGYTKSGEAKADTLDLADKNYMFSGHFSYCVLRIAYIVLRIQTNNIIS